MKRAFIGVIIIFGLFGCTKVPEIKMEQVESDLLGRSVADGLSDWVFNESDQQFISLVETTYEKTKAGVVVDAESRHFPNISKGRLRLNYEWVAKEWNLLEIENLSFKRSSDYEEGLDLAMMDLRSIAVCFGAYGTDNDVFPTVSAITELVPLVSPVYVQKVPTIDPWGNEYLVKAGGQRFEIRSMGLDGKVTPNGEVGPGMVLITAPGDISSFEDDIIYINDLSE